jgi:hypothetical protein
MAKRESDRDRAYAAHPQSAAIQETAVAQGADAPAPGLSQIPRTDDGAEDEITYSTVSSTAGPVPLSQPPRPAVPDASGTKARRAGRSARATAAATRPAPAKRVSTPDRRSVEDGTRTAEPVPDRHHQADTAEDRDQTTEARRRAGTAERRRPNPDAGEGVAGGTSAYAAPAGAQGPLGKWPVRADDPHGEVGDGQPGSGDGAASAGPYIDRGEELERVGATSGMAPRARQLAWSRASARYRQEWEESQTAAAQPWEVAEPAYRYGYEMSADPRYEGRAWEEVEPQLGAGYPEWARRAGYQGQDNGWDRVKENVRTTWERSRSRQ